jgi:hypothetical protein
MEYKEACWDEPVDEHLVAEHARRIFPLMRRRRLFSGSENFVLYDFFVDGAVNEDVFAYSNRHGDERGLVLYHNRYAKTAGWVRTSTSRAVNPGEAEPILAQTTLGDAFGIKGDGRHYYVFRDLASGLEYLRNGRELGTQGLFVELEPYEYHAFLDFREIWDDEFGTWGRLCHLLDGRAVPDMDEEVTLVRYEVLLKRFRKTVSVLAESFGLVLGERETAASVPTLGRFRRPLRAFLATLGETAGCAADPHVAAGEILGRLRTLRAGFRAADSPAGRGTSPHSLAALDTAERFVLMAVSLLRACTALIAGAAESERPTSWFGTYGVRRALIDVVRQVRTTKGKVLFLEPERTVQLVDILMTHAGFCADLLTGGRGPTLRNLMADAAVARFLGVHQAGGVEWFVREPFEQLFRLLAALPPDKELPTRRRGAAAAKIEAELATIRLAAAEAGYRTDTFMALLAPQPKGKGKSPSGTKGR